MCEILIIPAIKEHKSKETAEFILEMAGAMSKRNDDGLGYTAVARENNEIIVERWHKNDEAFDVRPAPIVFSETDNELMGMMDSLKSVKLDKDNTKSTSKYNKMGSFVLDSDESFSKIKAITLHTRMATSGKEFANTHPFVRQSKDKERVISLIHNGVINNPEKHGECVSTCDSEAILNLYLKHNVAKDMNNINKVSEDLDGYYACAVINRINNKDVFLDVFKDSKASLCLAYIKELETYVFTTNQYKLKEVCDALSYTIYKLFDVKDNVIMRIDVDSGLVLNEATFEVNNVYKFNGVNNYGHTPQTKHGNYNKHTHTLSTLDKNDGWYKTKDETWRKTNSFNND